MRVIRGGGPRIDTVGVWGSNPHAPTNEFNGLKERRSIVAAFCVIDCAINPALVIW